MALAGPQESNDDWEKMPKSLDQLFAGGDLTACKLAKDNPESIAGFKQLTIPVVDHDYPASTPAMWNAAYRKFGFANAANVMVAADPAKSGEIFAAFKADARYQGGGVGSGFKIIACEYLDEIDPLAKAIGAVNIIVKNQDGSFLGYNTDGVGYVQSLVAKLAEQGRELSGQKVVILGGGGTANAIAFSLVAQGAQVSILNRTVATAETLAKRIQDHFGKAAVASFGGEDEIILEAQQAVAVVNVSLKGAVGDWEKFSALAPAKAGEEKINQDQAREVLQSLRALNHPPIISDINEQNNPTVTLDMARQEGLATLGGLGMVVNQGIQSFMLVHGKELAAKGFTETDVKRVMQEAVRKGPG